MRSLLFFSVLAAGFLAQPASADPYRWCAEYGGGGRGGGTNCYFLTFEQCRQAIQGMGGFCRENTFYDGRPVRTPEDNHGSGRRRYDR